MEYYWNLDKKKATRITHVASLEHANIESMRMYISGREAPGNDWAVVNNTENMYPMPLDPNALTAVYNGPAAYPRAELIHNQKAYLEIMDNGVSVPAWAAGVQGAMIAVWGKKYEGLPA
jgi:hypothetical protein